jgi:acyl carrier protein phosphodiesterase
MHRFVWDLHYERPAALNTEYPIAAILHDTPREPRGPWALPGRYTVRLTVNGTTYTQPLTVRMDPRVKTSLADLRLQFATAERLTKLIQQDYDALSQVRTARRELQKAREQSGAVRDSMSTVDARLAALEAGAGGRGGRGGATAAGFVSLNGDLAALYRIVEGADAAPTTQALAAIADRQRQLESLLASWRAMSKP